MNIATRKIQGLNTSVKNKEIGVYTAKNNIIFMGILKTRIRYQNLNKALSVFKKGW